MPQPILALEGGTRFPQEYDNWIRRPSDFEIAETRNAFRKILCLSWIRRSSKIGGANLAPQIAAARGVTAVKHNQQFNDDYGQFCK